MWIEDYLIAHLMFPNGTGIGAQYIFDPLLEAFNALKDKLAVVYVPDNITDQEKEKTYVEKMP